MKILNKSGKRNVLKIYLNLSPPTYIPFAFYKLTKGKEEKRSLKLKGNADRTINWY